MSPQPQSHLDHLPWLIKTIPEDTLRDYRSALFRLRSTEEPLIVLDALTTMQRITQDIERIAVAEARTRGATWGQVAEAVGRTRQAVEQRFG
jgi:hypothetical protein